MNAVLQQLYMIPPVRSGILEVDEPAKCLMQQDEEEERKLKEMEANRRNREEVCDTYEDLCAVHLTVYMYALQIAVLYFWFCYVGENYTMYHSIRMYCMYFTTILCCMYEANLSPLLCQLLDPGDSDEPLPSPSDIDRKDTHRKVLMQLQSIFGHLLEGRLQFHVPKGFWRDFR